MRVLRWPVWVVLWPQFATAVSGADDPLADPMRPPVAPILAITDQAPLPDVDFLLSATKVNPGHHTAIINNQLVAEGDALNGAIVLKISPAEVVIKVGATTTTLKLNANAIKHRVE